MNDDDDQKPQGHKIGDEKLCKITSKAADKVAQLLSDQNRASGALRVSVVGGGASGLKYKIELVEGPTPKDYLITTKSIRIVIDNKSALFISGSTVDLNAETGDFEVTKP